MLGAAPCNPQMQHTSKSPQPGIGARLSIGDLPKRSLRCRFASSAVRPARLAAVDCASDILTGSRLHVPSTSFARPVPSWVSERFASGRNVK
jgi:hypothetical protein